MIDWYRYCLDLSQILCYSDWILIYWYYFRAFIRWNSKRMTNVKNFAESAVKRWKLLYFIWEIICEIQQNLTSKVWIISGTDIVFPFWQKKSNKKMFFSLDIIFPFGRPWSETKWKIHWILNYTENTNSTDLCGSWTFFFFFGIHSIFCAMGDRVNNNMGVGVENAKITY